MKFDDFAWGPGGHQAEGIHPFCLSALSFSKVFIGVHGHHWQSPVQTYEFSEATRIVDGRRDSRSYRISRPYPNSVFSLGFTVELFSNDLKLSRSHLERISCQTAVNMGLSDI